MSIQQFPASNRATINWASGTSTELFIYPADAQFGQRNFQFRISTATVEAEESTFTFFEGITRHLMILKGNLELIHLDRYTKHLGPFEQDTFSGEWSTQSKGKGTDFNLMLKDGATGSLTHHRIETGKSAQFTSTANFYFLYLVSGTATLSNGNTAIAGDLLWIEQETEAELQVLVPCDIIEIEVVVD
jgi:environmental stress-induced protein Ves